MGTSPIFRCRLYVVGCMEKNRESCYTVEKNLTLVRLSIGGATFVKAVRCYAAAVLSFAQAMRDFVTAMRNGVAAKYIKKREWMLETRD